MLGQTRKEFATMKTNKITKVLALSMLGLLALTACDNSITAHPTQYDEPLITTPNYSDELYHNIDSVVYDAIENDGIGSDVLNEVLYLYGVSAFGPLNSKVKVNNALVPEDEITLEQAATDASKIDAFVLKHKAYWDESTHESATASESEKKRVETKYSSIQSRIAEKMYEKISGGSYSDRHEFYEERFLKSLRSSLESVADPADPAVTPHAPRQILPEYEPEEVFDQYLHREYYDGENRYIIDEIVPGIYRELLTEQYILDETYNSLGRSYARQVNIIKFANNDNYPNTAYYLAKNLVKEINSPTYDTETIASYGEGGLLRRFKEYSTAQVGIVGDIGSAARDILIAANIPQGQVNVSYAPLKTKLEDELGIFYDGTSYGDLAYKFVKMSDTTANGINSELENTFTNNGAYPTYVGLEQEKMTLAENDYTTTGWFVKNGGLTDLPESVRSRLFNIGVATGIKDNPAEQELEDNKRNYSDGEWHEAANENAYVCRINHHYYLKTASRVKGDAIDNDILHYDADSKTYYIVEIEQAVSSSKLSKTGDRNYAHTEGEAKMQEIIDEVAKIVAKGETYSTLAAKKYLKAMNIQYHDDAVYEYFKSNYPELFGEEESTSNSEEAAE